MANQQNCLALGPTPVGSKAINMGNGVFDNVTLKLKSTPEAEHLLNETEKHLKEQYKNIYDGTMQGLYTFPPHYDFCVDTKKNDTSEKGEWARQARRTMQYVDESLIQQRIQQLDQKQNLSTFQTEDCNHFFYVLC